MRCWLGSVPAAVQRGMLAVEWETLGSALNSLEQLGVGS